MKKFTVSPDWQLEKWYGFDRYRFKFEGRDAWVAVPYTPAGDGRWTWCTQWAEAFVERVGTTDLLSRGFHHAHIDVFDTRCNAEGVAVMHRFQEFLVSRGLAEQVNLIGMSWGGFFALRYNMSYPEAVKAIYLDAPVCNAADSDASAADRVEKICECYQLSREELAKSPLNPVNRAQLLIEQKMPLFIATGEDDLVVKVASNINLLTKVFDENNFAYQIERRPVWGHHPHGFDDRSALVSFHESVHQQ
ncbi:MAG: alpha/beta hydrolase [Lentisphaerae bacterium]|nr:alpha/beta hydrolase [Lentisphaerota bacterium]